MPHSFHQLKRLLDQNILIMEQPIYAVVSGDQVVGGPYLTRQQAEAYCDSGEEVIEILPTDQGYEEFKSIMR